MTKLNQTLVKDAVHEPQKHGIRNQRILFGLLFVAILAWCVTLPIRNRMLRETERLNRQADAALALQRQTASLMTQAKQAVQAAPDQPGPRLAYAALLQRSGDLAEAETQLKTGLASSPNDAELLASLGEIFETEHKEDLGIDEYRRALAIDPKNVHALKNLAMRYIALGWNRMATDLLERAIKEEPNEPRLHIALGLVSYQNGGDPKAINELLQAHQLAPDDPTILPPLIDTYRKSKRFAEAQRWLDIALPNAPDKSSLLVEQAQIDTEENNPKAVLATTNEILRLAPNDLQAHYLRGVALRNLGETQAASQELERVYQTEPTFERVAYQLGHLRLSQGRTQEAKRLLAEAKRMSAADELGLEREADVADAPNLPEPHRKVGQYYLQHHDAPRAIVEFKRVLELQPNDQEARRSLIDALRIAGRGSEADSLNQR